jgi:membrane associated rhomboid family serine protease
MSFWRGRGLNGSFYVLGTRIPAVTGALIGLTLVLSIAGAVAAQARSPLAGWLILVPERVWNGEAWRLLTWIFVEGDPLALLFGCLGLWWFGSDLNHDWGPRRYLALVLSLAVLPALVTCGVGRLLWPTLLVTPYFGIWAVVDALLIAWAVLYPHRPIFVYFVLPLGGRLLIYATVGGTLLFALFYGFERYLPHFLAEGLMFVYLRPVSPRYLWLRFKYAMATRKRTRLRSVDRREREEPPRWLH